jgi:ABC-type antimicrobial peptide transport system permease subunit
MSTWIDDLRHAFRVLRRTSGTTLITLVTLALGAAGTTTLFSVVYGVLLRPLPYPEPDRIVMIWQHDPARPAERILVGAFSTVGVLLAALGLYGIMAHGVVQRTREIGIRVALGATHGDVSWLILRQGFIVTLAGILIGLLGVTLTARVLGTLLYATSPVDPLALAIAILLLMAAALSAAYIPARRATGVEPIVALRDE